ncbi:MAG: peptidoglycan-associated lipoprotein Pal [Desulfobacterales bacterium]|nr:peptidoglycan-associated lipoprotein Pal [Desulfobacterales bacterium]
MKKISRLALAVILALSVGLAVSGCSRKKVVSEAGPAAPAPVVVTPDSGDTGGMAATEEPLDSTGPAVLAGAQTILEGRTSAPLLPVYFDFDKSNIRADQVERIKQNGAFLQSNPATAVRIEGNCDERGTNEYNAALGERRALSAKKYLVNLGVSAGRLTTISYGEERPLLHGHDELSWAQNRRADFVINR